MSQVDQDNKPWFCRCGLDVWFRQTEDPTECYCDTCKSRKPNPWTLLELGIAEGPCDNEPKHNWYINTSITIKCEWCGRTEIWDKEALAPQPTLPMEDDSH